MPDYGRAFALLRQQAVQDGGVWEDYTRHPFVEGLRDGSLPRDAFLHYLVQDYLFLIHFARAWALAVVKSDGLDEMKQASATVDGLVNIEIAHHIGVCAAHGISQAQLDSAAEHPANMTYTRYVLDAGVSGDLADLLVALMPCVLGYGEIGARLARESVADNPYAEWINTYAGAEYQQVCTEAGQLLDRALERRIGADFAASPRWQRLCNRFITATRLEVDFWGMGLTP